MWIFLAFLSAFGLGLYDICKKQALSSVAVIPVLTGSVVLSSLLLLPWLIFSRLQPESASDTLIYVARVGVREHMLIFLKSALVLSSWICGFAAMRRLPITVVTPVNATRPIWTLVGALVIFGEVLSPYQWAGVIVAIVSFVAFALVSMPRISRHSEAADRVRLAWLLLFGAVILGAASGLYDKHLMRHIDRNAVLVFYTFYQAAMMLVVLLLSHQKLSFNPWIIGVSVFLIGADFAYLYALTDPSSLIAIVSIIRRSSVLLSFAYGAVFLHEKNILRKSFCLAGILLAMVLLLLGSL